MLRFTNRLRVAFVASWVPRRCGIATFTRDLRDAVHGADSSTHSAVVAIDEPDSTRTYDGTVIGRIRQYNPESYRAAARSIEQWRAHVVSIEHEFGLYGTDRDGAYHDHLVGLLDALTVPAITTFHTVLPEPAPWMRRVVRDIAERSASIVVMTDTAARLLTDVYGVRRAPDVIMHGVPTVAPSLDGHDAAKRRLGLEGKSVILTFGLVDPRKGIEYAIDALAPIVARHPNAVYVIAGQTHPELQKRDGERYREELVRRVESLSLGDSVRFMNEYLTIEKIVELLEATDVYVTPYLDPNQITSGTLAYALGAGRAIISTPYLHAVEALSGERGLLTDFRSSEQIADAALSILDDPAYKHRLEARAYAYGCRAAWPEIGRRTLSLMAKLASEILPKPAWPSLPLPVTAVSAPVTNLRGHGHAA